MSDNTAASVANMDKAIDALRQRAANLSTDILETHRAYIADKRIGIQMRKEAAQVLVATLADLMKLVPLVAANNDAHAIVNRAMSRIEKAVGRWGDGIGKP
jgi:hypothetical protein